LKSFLYGKTSAFSGNSGVGKSSITQEILNDYPKTIDIGEIGQKSKRGKHTTKSVNLYALNNNTYILDTPGFSSYELYDVEHKELRNYYKEFINCNCDYDDCAHVIEADTACDVKRKVKDENIDCGRYERYVYIYNKLKEKYDRKVRDTKLLLNNYRRFNKHIKQTTYTEKQLETATVAEILDKLYIVEDDEKDDATIVQAILKSKKRTEIILNHMNTILAGYEENACKSKDIELKRRLQVINKLYIDDKKGKSFEEIAEELNTSTSTVKRDRNRAIKEISILLFGIDGIRFD